MRIAVFGASLVSGYVNSAAAYCRGVLSALGRRGHAIRFYEPLAPETLARRDVLDPAWAEIVRFAADGDGVEAALADVADADVLVKCSDVGAFDELLNGAVPRCAPPSALSIYWDLDPAATLQRLAADSRDPLRSQLPLYDAVLIRYGGEAALDAFQRFGARSCFPVYAATHIETHQPVAREAAYAATMTLIADIGDSDAAEVQRGLIDVAATMSAHDFVLGAPGWEEAALPKNVRYVGYVYAAERELYYVGAVAVRNLTRADSAALGYAPNTPLLEAAAAGACIIAAPWEGLEAFFESGQELLVARDHKETVEQLTGLTPSRAAAIGRHARERCRREHTYNRRAVELEALLEGIDRHWLERNSL